MFATLTLFTAVALLVILALLHMTVARTAPASPFVPASRFAWLDSLTATVVLVFFIVLALTGFYSALVVSHMKGFVLMAHVVGGGAFAVALAALAIQRGESCLFCTAPGAPQGLRVVHKLAFWLLVAATVVLIATASIAMLPLLGTAAQYAILDTHRYAALAAVVGGVVYLYSGLAIRAKRSRSEVGK